MLSIQFENQLAVFYEDLAFIDLLLVWIRESLNFLFFLFCDLFKPVFFSLLSLLVSAEIVLNLLDPVVISNVFLFVFVLVFLSPEFITDLFFLLFQIINLLVIFCFDLAKDRVILFLILNVNGFDFIESTC